MARTGMANIIAEARQLCNLGTADYTIGATTYWSDDHVQNELDRFQQTVSFQPLVPVEKLAAGVLWVTDYLMPDVVLTRIEEYTVSGDSGFAVKDLIGTVIDTTTYTVDYRARRVSFTANQIGKVLYLDCRAYDMDKAAAAIWKKKAAAVYARVDWSSDNHRFTASQEYEHCMAMAASFETDEGITVSRLKRTDEQRRPAGWPNASEYKRGRRRFEGDDH